MYPYKIQRVHALRDADFGKRLEFANFIMDQDAADSTFFNSICFSDESTFHVSGMVHRHNCRIWGTEKLRETAAIFSDMVVGPFFFDEKSVTQANFLKMLNKQIIPAI